MKYLPLGYLGGGQLGEEKADKQPVEADKSVLAQQQAVLLFILHIRKHKSAISQLNPFKQPNNLSSNPKEAAIVHYFFDITSR
jgi:hypothetical protein